MRPTSLTTLLDYLRDLGARHQDIRTSVISLQFAGLQYESYPVVWLESDPFVESKDEGANIYRVALWVLVRDARTTDNPRPILLSQAIQLADELLQQLLREQQVQQLGQPTMTLHPGTANEGLDTGVRVEVALILPKAVNRHTNPGKFTPLDQSAGFPLNLPTT